MMGLRRPAAAAVALAIGVLLSGCASSGPGNAGASAPVPAQSSATAPSRLVSPAQFASVVKDPRTVTVNVHTPFAGALPDTDLFIAFDSIRAKRAQLPADRSARLAIYCRSGRMSAIAARTLASLGYTNIVELAGGMQAWQAAGRPISQRAP